MKLLSTVTLIFAGLLAKPVPIFGLPLTADELKEKYPDLVSTRAGNSAILCPFVRMLERSGALDELKDGDEIYTPGELQPFVQEFALDCWLSRLIPWGTGLGQEEDVSVTCQEQIVLAWLNPFKSTEVDLETFFEADIPVLAFPTECSVNFEDKGESGWSEARYNYTMSKLDSKADAEGHLSYEAVLNTKVEICSELDKPYKDNDMKLMFTFLGGLDRGYIDLADVGNLLKLDSEMPAYKAKEEITRAALDNEVFNIPGSTSL